MNMVLRLEEDKSERSKDRSLHFFGDQHGFLEEEGLGGEDA